MRTEVSDLALPLLVFMLVCTVIVVFWSRHIYKQQNSGLTVRKAKPFLLHSIGCLAFAVLPLSMLMMLPHFALLPAVFFFISAIWRGKINWSRTGVLLLCAAVWLADWQYEIRLHEWSLSVNVPIRIDIYLLAPILYLSSVIGLGMANASRDSP